VSKSTNDSIDHNNESIQNNINENEDGSSRNILDIDN